MGLVTLFGAKIPIFPICCHLHKDDDSYVEYLSDEKCFRNGVRLDETMHTTYRSSGSGVTIYDQGGRTLVS